MNKKQCLIVIGGMTIGGVQKSLIAFLNYLKNYSDIDLIIWKGLKNELSIPNEINILKIPTVKSVKACLKENGFFSKSLFFSLIGSLSNKRWKFLPGLRKKYDIAIAYDHNGYSKYFVIDKVNAEKKFAFYHHGVYSPKEFVKKLDFEYYPKFNGIFGVSESNQKMLNNIFSLNNKINYIPNLIDINNIFQQSDEICSEFDNINSIKILTVARLSEEKNIEKCIEFAYNLSKENIDFKWCIVGDGPEYNKILEIINNYKLNDKVILCGSQINPYKYMKSCDIYVQLSKFESEGITIKEVVCFNKPMLLSNIPTFQSFSKKFNNIILLDECAIDYVSMIKKLLSLNKKNNIDNINTEAINKIKKYIL